MAQASILVALSLIVERFLASAVINGLEATKLLKIGKILFKICIRAERKGELAV
jgi:hypothetical protein